MYVYTTHSYSYIHIYVQSRSTTMPKGISVFRSKQSLKNSHKFENSTTTQILNVHVHNQNIMQDWTVTVVTGTWSAEFHCGPRLCGNTLHLIIRHWRQITRKTMAKGKFQYRVERNIP